MHKLIYSSFSRKSSASSFPDKLRVPLTHPVYSVRTKKDVQSLGATPQIGNRWAKNVFRNSETVTLRVWATAEIWNIQFRAPLMHAHTNGRLRRRTNSTRGAETTLTIVVWALVSGVKWAEPYLASSHKSEENCALGVLEPEFVSWIKKRVRNDMIASLGAV